MRDAANKLGRHYCTGCTDDIQKRRLLLGHVRNLIACEYRATCPRHWTLQHDVGYYVGLRCRGISHALVAAANREPGVHPVSTSACALSCSAKLASLYIRFIIPIVHLRGHTSRDEHRGLARVLKSGFERAVRLRVERLIGNVPMQLAWTWRALPLHGNASSAEGYTTLCACTSLVPRVDGLVMAVAPCAFTARIISLVNKTFRWTHHHISSINLRIIHMSPA
jgi:hypothetical protein